MTTAIPTSERRVSNVGIALLDEDGNFEAVEIDEADEEIDDDESRDTPMPLQESQNSSNNKGPTILNARRQSITDRMNKRRHSEFAVEILRLSAEDRRREFAELLEQHSRLVQSIDIYKKTGVFINPNEVTSDHDKPNTEADESTEENQDSCVTTSGNPISRAQRDTKPKPLPQIGLIPDLEDTSDTANSHRRASFQN